jgi:nanoRNase/pAp phosphatase (c-di-AMP/oligoRNAs hydrolase)
MLENKKFRLITRSDMDGLVCAVFLKYLNIIDDIKFAHPKDMQDGKVEVTPSDITTNLPFVEGVHMCFDHHVSETLRNEARENHIIIPNAPSAAEVVFRYYGGWERFPRHFEPMLLAANKADTASFEIDEIIEPQGWDLLSFIMDSRTGLGRFKDFRISNYSLMMDLIDYCSEHTIEEVLNLPDVKERVDLYFEYEREFKEQIQRCSTIHDNVIVLDLTNEETVYPGNRFLIYAMYPRVNVSIHKIWGFKKQNVVYAVGKSIINKSCSVNIGELLLQYSGGGHEAAGTCQTEEFEADQILEKLIGVLQ